MTDEQKFVLEKNLNRFDSYINATNTKAAFLVSFNTFTLGTLLLKYEFILASFALTCLAQSAMILLWICLSSLAFAIFQSFLAVSPFLKAGANNGQPDTVFFFLSVARMDKGVYLRRLTELTQDDLFLDLSNQTHVLAKAADKKFTRIKRAIIATMFGTIFTLFLTAVLRVIDWVAN